MVLYILAAGTTATSMAAVAAVGAVSSRPARPAGGAVARGRVAAPTASAIASDASAAAVATGATVAAVASAASLRTNGEQVVGAEVVLVQVRPDEQLDGGGRGREAARLGQQRRDGARRLAVVAVGAVEAIGAVVAVLARPRGLVLAVLGGQRVAAIGAVAAVHAVHAVRARGAVVAALRELLPLDRREEDTAIGARPVQRRAHLHAIGDVELLALERHGATVMCRAAGGAGARLSCRPHATRRCRSTSSLPCARGSALSHTTEGGEVGGETMRSTK